MSGPGPVVEPTGLTTAPITLAAAGEALWGEAGRHVYATYRRLRAELFPQLPEELPIVIGLTAYGHCLGLTRYPWEHGARVTLAPLIFAQGRGMVDDILLHESRGRCTTPTSPAGRCPSGPPATTSAHLWRSPRTDRAPTGRVFGPKYDAVMA